MEAIYMSNIKKKDGWVRVVNGQPKIGQFSERSRTTKISDIHAFTEMTGDKNPVHYDEDLPGPGTVFLSTELKFLKAVGVGEELTARVEIESVRDDKPICKLKTTITDSAGDLCVDGTATTYTMALEGL
jgi:acyl dehydratase